MSDDYEQRLAEWKQRTGYRAPETLTEEEIEEAHVCERCGGDGMIEYNDGDGTDWGEDCPSEINHLITCRACNGRGRVK